ncbi:MAG TPA: hypothetical protein VGK27_05605 [Candidatus Deferrimicrobiaceae bacterium]
MSRRYRKAGWVLAVVMVMVFSASLAFADGFAMKDRYGAGVQLDAFNFGIGPIAEYWVTDQAGVGVGLGALGDFTTFSVRGNYLFDKEFLLFNQPTRPYAGIGYAYIKGPEEQIGVVKEKTKGSGYEIFGGFLQPAPYIAKDVYVGVDINYTSAKVEATYSSAFGSTSVDAGYNAFSLCGKVIYFFR